MINGSRRQNQRKMEDSNPTGATPVPGFRPGRSKPGCTSSRPLRSESNSAATVRLDSDQRPPPTAPGRSTVESRNGRPRRSRRGDSINPPRRDGVYDGSRTRYYLHHKQAPHRSASYTMWCETARHPSGSGHAVPLRALREIRTRTVTALNRVPLPDWGRRARAQRQAGARTGATRWPAVTFAAFPMGAAVCLCCCTSRGTRTHNSPDLSRRPLPDWGREAGGRWNPQSVCPSQHCGVGTSGLVAPAGVEPANPRV